MHPDIRQELSAARVASLHRSAEHAPAGPLRRAVGNWLVRLGLRLGYDGRVPPFVSQLGTEEVPVSAGTSSLSSLSPTVT